MPTTRRVVALTFDAGADDAGAPKITAALAKFGVTATFFMTGRWAELYPQWAARISAGYPVGNHTFDHQDLLTLPPPGIRSELLRASAAIKHATGHPPVPLFRFPYGSSNASSLALANQLGYTAVGWTVDTLGWEGTSAGQSIGSVTSRSLAHLQPGEIILMHVGANPHDHSTLDADTLRRIISAIRARPVPVRDPERLLVSRPGFHSAALHPRCERPYVPGPAHSLARELLVHSSPAVVSQCAPRRQQEAVRR